MKWHVIFSYIFNTLVQTGCGVVNHLIFAFIVGLCTQNVSLWALSSISFHHHLFSILHNYKVSMLRNESLC